MAKFTVTIQRTITTVVEVEATTAAGARNYVTSYGLVEAAMDMSRDDETTAHIKSVRKAA